MVATRRRNAVRLASIVLGISLSACGGGGGGAAAVDTGPPLLPPTNLVYGDGTPTYRTDGNIIPNTAQMSGGPPDEFTCVPPLPAGLVLNGVNGTISGIPTTPSPLTSHTITARNSAGATQSTVDIQVEWIHHKSIAVHQPVTDADVRHLLARTHFGFHQPSYDAIVTDGLAQHLSDTLDDIHSGATPALEAGADAFIPDKDFPGKDGLALWWLHCIQRTDNPLQEALALHWHDHFACSSETLPGKSSHWYFDHINLWRHNAAGNLRDLILAMARDWSMLKYLDGVDSTKAIPNENFGREFLELFCNGVNVGYTYEDIVAASALFSGYRSYFDGTQLSIAWTPSQHNDDDHTYLGVEFTGQTNPPSDRYAEVVDVTLAHRPPGDAIGYTSRWIVHSILRRFCLEAPDAVLIDQLASVLEANGWNLKPLFMTLFQSEAFFSAEAKKGFIKTPVEQIVGFIRTTNLPVRIEREPITDAAGLDDMLQFLGNRPTQPPVVAGWPEGESWLAAQGMIDRTNVINYIITSREFQDDEGVDLAELLPPGSPTAEEVVDALATRMHIFLSELDRNRMERYLNQDASGKNIVFDPFDASNAIHIDERIRGLLYIMGQHPLYVLR